MKNFIQYFASRPLFGNLLTAMVFIVGLYSTLTIQKDLFPPVDFDITLVTAVLPGAAPDQVEKLLINPLEEAIREVDGLKKVQSTASNGVAVITVTLDPDARSTEKTNADLQRAVDQVVDYPKEAERPILRQLESGQNPVIEVAISSETMGNLDLREWARKIADDLALVKGVAKVTKVGWQKRERLVELDPQQLKAQNVSFLEVVQSLQANNIQLPAGSMDLVGGLESPVKTDGELNSLEKLSFSPIRKNFEGYGVLLNQLGKVTEGLEEPTVLYRSRGTQAFSLIIIKKSKADALDVVANVQKRMKELEPGFPKEVKYTFVNDFTEYLKNRIGILGGNMVMGIILVTLILASFLPWRVAIVVAMGIPFSMLAAIAILQKLGFSLNLISMIGLIIVSGMLVDDAIVVVENIFRKIEEGCEFQQALIEGTSEMVVPVCASIMTTVAAFAPMMFMTGIFGKFVFSIPVMVIIPLLVSLFEAFIVAPVHFSDWVGAAQAKIISAQAQKNEIGWYQKLIIKYDQWIQWTLSNLGRSLGILLGIFIVIVFMATKMNFVLFPPDGVYSFFIKADAEPGLRLEFMSEKMKLIEAKVAELPPKELRDFITRVGIQQQDGNDPFTKRAPHYGQIQVNLTPETDRERSISEVVDSLRESIGQIEGLKIQFEVQKGGPPQGKPISVNVAGSDFEEMGLAANQLKKWLSEISGVTDIEDSEVIGKKEWVIRPDQIQAARLGLTTTEIASTLRAVFTGLVATSVRTIDEEIDIRVRMQPKEGDPKALLQGVNIGNRQGNLIALQKVTQAEEVDSRLSIKHEKYKRIITVGAQVDLEKTTALIATKELQKLIDQNKLKFPNVNFEYGGENEDTEESLASLGRAFLFAGMTVFVILILTFGSFAQPLLVLVTIPLGFAGTVVGLVLHGKPLSFMALLGIIALAGVIVNNAIIIIDFYNEARRNNVHWQEAIRLSATKRLRPVLLTSVTTVLGLMPTAYGIGGYDGFVAALAMSLGWGLMIGSVLTMLFFPAILAAFEKIRLRKELRAS